MKGVSQWSFQPYRPPMFETGEPYICRVCPGEGSVGFDWLDPAGEGKYTAHLRRRGSSEDFLTLETEEGSARFDGLDDGADYEFYVSCGERRSRVRLARTGAVPGTSVVNYLHPEDGAYAYSGQYLCSPSMVRLPDGALLASMDVFRGGAPQDLTLIYRSDDDGITWRYVSELFPCFWGKLFLHRGALYMLSCSTEYGDLLIGRSDDGGKTFGMPTVLLRGSSGFRQPGVHKNPQPVIEYGGRLWATLEWGSWATGTHAAMVGSVDAEDDLLRAENWRFTPPVPYDPSWKGTAVGPSAGCIEGCLTAAPDGQLYSVMRYQMGGCTPSYGRAVVMKPKPADPEAPLAFERVIEFPGNHSKFTIQRDPVSGKYLSLASYLCPGHPDGRNWLALLVSDDPVRGTWRKALDVFDYRDTPIRDVGFQYVDFFPEGDDLLLLCRTAWNGAANFHDANYSVFHRIRGFRDRIRSFL